MAELHESGVPVTGELLRSVGDHARVASQLLDRTQELHAGAIVIGPDERSGPLGPGVASVLAAQGGRDRFHVLVLHPEAGSLGRPDAAGTSALGR